MGAGRKQILGVSKSRIESLSDGIFATVMTILVLSLVVPTITGPNVSTQLNIVMVSLIPNILIYIATFLLLGFIWVGHHNMFWHIEFIDRNLLWLNLLFLLSVGIVPFSTTLLGRYPLQQISILIYGVNGLGISLIFSAVWYYAITHCLYRKESASYINYRMRINLVGPGFYTFAIIVSYLNIWISLAIYALFPIFFIGFGRTFTEE